jgi:hypothetical protein
MVYGASPITVSVKNKDFEDKENLPQKRAGSGIRSRSRGQKSTGSRSKTLLRTCAFGATVFIKMGYWYLPVCC